MSIVKELVKGFVGDLVRGVIMSEDEMDAVICSHMEELNEFDDNMIASEFQNSMKDIESVEFFDTVYYNMLQNDMIKYDKMEDIHLIEEQYKEDLKSDLEEDYTIDDLPF